MVLCGGGGGGWSTVIEWSKFGQNGGCMASLGVGVCILSRYNKKPRRGAKLREGGGTKI